MLVSNVLSGNIAVFSVSATGTLSMVGAPIATGPAGSRAKLNEPFAEIAKSLPPLFYSTSPLESNPLTVPPTE